MDENALSNKILGAAIEVHRQMGPGLLESVYEECLAYELGQRNIPFERQKRISLSYKEQKLDANLRLDFLVGNLVIVELKSVAALIPLHNAQVLTYLKLTNCKLGMLLNFNTILMKDGIKRIVHNL